MIDLRFVPLDLAKFPGGVRPASKRRASSAFRSSYIQTLNRLESELRSLGAVDVVVQAGYNLREIRNDGWPYASAKASHPAVVLAFRSRKSGEEYSFPCDTFSTFEHNLHAIAYTLESLRDVARYGVTRGHEQYRGFAQLPAAPDADRWTIDQAARWLSEVSKFDGVEIILSAGVYRDAYRDAATRLHPDIVGNEPHHRVQWDRLQRAKDLLDKRHALGAKGAPE